MIAGLLLRNFKTYKGINFIPFITNDIEYLEVFIGDNGTGKSSILEALNAYYNNGKWIHTTGLKDSYVAPLFLLEKDKYKSKFSSKTLELVKKLNTFFWELPITGARYSQSQQAIISYIATLKPLYESTHYLLLLGVHQEERNNLFFATFDKDIKTNILGYEWDEGVDELRKKTDQTAVNKVMVEFGQTQTFIYIPAEENIAEFLRLESEDMQELVNRKIKDDIEDVLKQPYSEATGKESVLEYVNKRLMPYIEDVEKTIQKIDEAYKFKGATKLTSRDLIAPIIKVFYQKRKLEKNNKPIADLSSGERKKALVDIVYSFLSQKAVTEKEIIFAIDEPEASLDTINRYDSFERIEKIANEYKHQTFITTHWYGLLPIIHKGIIHYLELSKEDEIKPVLKKYDARNFIEARKRDPDDNYFKSFSDLASSIFSSLRVKKINWLIVEGVDDKHYLEYYLSNLIETYHESFRIIPLGGSGNVKVLYEHLYIPVENSSSDKIYGIVFCLVDKDEGLVKIIFDSKTKNKKLHFKRLQHASGEIRLLNANETNSSKKTDMEDALEPKKFYDAIKAVIDKEADGTVKEAFENFKYNEQAQTSEVEGDNSILSPAPKEGVNPAQVKKQILDFINKLDIKEKISLQYCQMPFEGLNVPVWIPNSLLPYFLEKQEIESLMKKYLPISTPESLIVEGSTEKEKDAQQQ